MNIVCFTDSNIYVAHQATTKCSDPPILCL